MRMAIQSDTLADMAAAVRGLTHENKPLTPAEMAEAVSSHRLGVPVSAGVSHDHMANGKWVRPEGWPDLDALKATIPDGETCVYLTYVLDLVDRPYVGLYATGAAWYAERGHVEGGQFVADESTSVKSGSYYRAMLDPSDGAVQLWRMRSSGNVTRIGFAANSGTNAQNYAILAQPCAERAGRLPHLTSMAGLTSTSGNPIATSAYNSVSFVTALLERDSLDIGGVVTTLAAAYRYAWSLRELDTSGWGTTGWHVTNLSYAFSSAPSLEVLDTTGWDTSNWAVTTMAAMFSASIGLQRILGIGDWDTSNWAVTTMASMFSTCHSLRELDIGRWDTSNWAVTSMSAMFLYCTCLESLDLSGWDTSGWRLTGTNTTIFQCCRSMRELDISGWDTSDWTLGTEASTFAGMTALEKCSVVDFGRSSGGANFPTDSVLLREFGGRKDVYATVNMRNLIMLTHESLVDIIDNLPNVSSTASLQIGNGNLLKLTAEERAVATAKGWSVVA